MQFSISVDREDLKEIKEHYEKLSNWLCNNFVSFSACAFVLQSVMSAVDEAEKRLNGANDSNEEV